MYWKRHITLVRQWADNAIPNSLQSFGQACGISPNFWATTTPVPETVCKHNLKAVWADQKNALAEAVKLWEEHLQQQAELMMEKQWISAEKAIEQIQ